MKGKDIKELFTSEELESIIHNLADYMIVEFVNTEEISENIAIDKALGYIGADEYSSFSKEQRSYLKKIMK